jgi:hypoxanthine phosphoribosyltransferase
MIDSDCRDVPMTLVIVLKGATVFAADLMRQIAVPFVIDFIAASSYRGTQSSGSVLIRDRSGLDLRGHHVILVDDIVDTGLTITAIIEELRRLEPTRIDVCALLHKQVAGARPVDIRYKGFDIPDCFVVGYGMDYRERLRNLPGIYRLILDR